MSDLEIAINNALCAEKLIERCISRLHNVRARYGENSDKYRQAARLEIEARNHRAACSRAIDAARTPEQRAAHIESVS